MRTDSVARVFMCSVALALLASVMLKPASMSAFSESPPSRDAIIEAMTASSIFGEWVPMTASA